MINYNNKGFTLIEVILTIAILGLIIVPLSSMFITSATMNTKSKTEYDAATIAQKYMEKVKGLNKYDASALTIDPNEDKPFDVSMTLDEVTGYPNMQVDASITPPYDIVIKEESGNIFFNKGDGSTIATIPYSTDFSMTFDTNSITINSNTYTYTGISNIKVGIYLTRSINIQIKNNRSEIINFEVIKNMSNTNICNLSVINGEIKKKTNILADPIEKLSNSVLYKVKISVKLNGDELVNMVGYKVFDK